MKLGISLSLLVIAGTSMVARADNREAATPAASAASQSSLPVFDPGTEIVTWNGKSWNITNNRIFQARFEKYLSTPEYDTLADLDYFKTLSALRDLLAPAKTSIKSLEQAFKMLGEAGSCNADDRLCDAIANQVYSAWLSKKSGSLLHSVNGTLEEERKRLEWNIRMAAAPNGVQQSLSIKTSAGNTQGQQQSSQVSQNTQVPQNAGPRAFELQQLATRLAEVNVLLKGNQAKKEVSQTQAKTDFQVLIVQLFLQRRFEHVLIATRFYRSVFTEGDSQQIKVGQDAQSFFSKTTGNGPTLASLEAISSEMISDANNGTRAFDVLLVNGQMESAGKRLSEAFLIGEYIPSVNVVPMAKKQQVLLFTQKSNQLVNALQVKDYALAATLVSELQASARDFDASQANAAIQTAKAMSGMRLAKARNAAVSGDKATLETELKAAAEIWPTNPALSDVAGGIFNQGDIQARALTDFDQLVSQKNYRQIYNDRMRFIAAVATQPDKQVQLQKVLEDIMTIEGAIMRAQELEKRGDPSGAWESAEASFRKLPDDPRLNQVRANLTTQAADFVRAISTGEKLEVQGQPGSSLSWYLQAQILYPSSEFAKAGIQRIARQIMPDSQ